jgi:hypothetical protein
VRVHVEPTSAEISVEPGGQLREGDVEFVDGPSGDATAVIRVELLGQGILVRTPPWSSGLADLTLMLVDETGRLFVGAKRTSCVVDLERRMVAHAFDHCLFWGFDRTTRPGWILETGELDCLFRALDGRVLTQVPVDPPWESVVEADGVRFQSIVHGTTFLKFPDAP